MAAFGNAVGSISLTLELFNTSIQGLCAVSRARHLGENQLEFTVKLDLEIARLVLWGRNAGLDHDQLDPSLVPLRPLLEQILGKIASSVKSAEHLKATYDLDVVMDAEAQLPLHSSTPRPANSRIDILALPQVVWEEHRQQSSTSRLKRRMSLVQQIKWVVWDGVKATEFVNTIKYYVDGLNQLLTESQKATLDAEMTALRISLLGVDWSHPTKMLLTIEDATRGRYEAIALPARLSRLRLELELEQLTPSYLGAREELAEPITIEFAQVQPLGIDRAKALYQNMKVLIEWRVLATSEASGEVGNARSRQAAKLVALFCELKRQQAEYRILDCVGYVDQRDRSLPRFGTVFSMPSSVRNVDSPTPFHSLFEYFTSEAFKQFQPSLDTRFRLAKTLATSFLQFHQIGWLHKNIRSHNIIFFPESTTASIEVPFILGFAFSRPFEAGVSDPVMLTEELKLYQHPDYQQKTDGGYDIRYDFYSIGLLLFEIAKWRPLRHYFTRLQRYDRNINSQTFVNKLVDEEKSELEFRMGSLYASAVLACLENRLENPGEDSTRTSLCLGYFDKVVKKLALCKA